MQHEDQTYLKVYKTGDQKTNFKLRSPFLQIYYVKTGAAYEFKHKLLMDSFLQSEKKYLRLFTEVKVRIIFK